MKAVSTNEARGSDARANSAGSAMIIISDPSSSALNTLLQEKQHPKTEDIRKHRHMKIWVELHLKMVYMSSTGFAYLFAR
jgi:hypothetical protein